MRTSEERGRERERAGPAAARRHLALALALIAFVPSVAADHVYSHRVYIVGRVLDHEDRPAAGVPIGLAFENVSEGGGCFDNEPERTGSRGDFAICRHVHAIPENATVTITAGNASKTVPIDPELRHASAHLRLDGPAPRDLNGDRHFSRTLLVTGRAFALLAEPYEEEEIMVPAVPLRANVTVELLVLDRVIASGVASPNEHGTYRVDLDVDEIPPTAIVRARVGSDVGEESASPIFRRADVNVVRDLRLIHGPGDDAPGSAPTPASAGGVLATLAVVALWARRRT